MVVTWNASMHKGGGIIAGLYSIYFTHVHHHRYVVDKRKEKGSVCLHKEWANFPEPFAYQTTVRDITAFAPEFKEKVTTLVRALPTKDSLLYTLRSSLWKLG